MLAGASLIGIGTAIGDRGQDVFRKVCEEINTWCEKEGIKNIAEMVGGMHKELASRP
ncbi:hypothetical protein COU79_03210 [Candidatus Peregrinibacteria bacterium CG10_big_fil_rev_8_21_14_0_10_54_7]|nr:MAG: hypothetical protein COU79_03210 [Candidatus Peregrinibacteria bacterium CG10_big_fil_rev_8_21_14_0_10_54_7]